MSDIMDRLENSTTKFKLGDNIHFEISSSSPSNQPKLGISQDQSKQRLVSNNQESASSVSKRKKKKNKKNKSKLAASTIHAHLNNPGDDYPTSRVIKQAPNGDVIVESLDGEEEEDDQDDDDEDDENNAECLGNNSHHHHHHHHHHHSHGRHHSDKRNDDCEYSSNGTSCNTRKNSSSSNTNLWDSASIEEQERLKEFWESLGESKKLELVRIDKDSIMKMFKSETRQHLQQLLSQNNGTSSGLGSNNNGSNGNNFCTCKYCGRRNNIIEEELENIYDNHFDDIIDFIHDVRDINDLNALPGLLFGGFHMLEEERRLQRRQLKFKEKWDQAQSQQHNHHHSNNHQLPPPTQQQAKLHSLNPTQVQNDIKVNFIQDQMEKFKNHIEKLTSASDQQNGEPSSNKSTEVHLRTSFDENDLKNSNESQLFNKLLDPKLFEALESMDLDKMKEISKLDPENSNSIHILEKATSLREIVRDLNNVDKANLQKGISYVSNMGKFFSNIAAINARNGVEGSVIGNRLDDQISKGLSTFAEDLLKNDGNSFIGMMEALSESRTAREELLKESPNATIHNTLLKYAWVDEDDKVEIEVHTCDNPHHHHHHHTPRFEEFEDDEEEEVEDADEEEEDDDEEDEDEDDEEDYEDEEEDEEDYDDDEDEDASDTESEISEEEKMQEIRRLFLIQVIKLFQERLKNAYKEKLSQDRTQKLIEELEAEENAKKEREMKKLKQKEKAKEKKRLQQLAKEEERKKKELELKAKEEEQRLQKEKLKAEQKKRKEEQKLKREEEKKKRMEELKRKEEEHKKKVEAQQKREEEAKRLKEERRKKAEEERKQKEEEKKQKEMLKKQKEEEKRQKELLKKKKEEEEARLKSEQQEKEEEEKQKRLQAQDHDDDDIVRQIESERYKFSTGNNPHDSLVNGNPLLNHLYQAATTSMPTTPTSDGFPTLTALQSVPPLIGQHPLQQQPQQVPLSLPQGQNLQQSIVPPPSSSTHQPPISQQYQYSSEFISNTFQNGSNLLKQPSIMNSPQTVSINLLNNGSSNTVTNGLNGGSGNATITAGNTLSPWSSKSRLNSLTALTQQPFSTTTGSQFVSSNPQSSTLPSSTVAGGVGSAQSSTNFSPFNAFADPLNTDTFISTPVSGNSNNIWMNSGNGKTTNLGTTGSRSNSIWSNPNEPSLISTNTANGSGLWNNSNNNNGNTTTNSSEVDLIQSTTFNCFQILQNSGQVEFGFAPLVNLFQNVKTILNMPNLSINQFISCCTSFNATSIYQFNLKYDEFGAVTHVNVVLNGLPRASPPPVSGQQVNGGGLSSFANTSSPPGLFSDQNGVNSSFLSPIGELTNNTGNSNGLSRKLWN